MEKSREIRISFWITYDGEAATEGLKAKIEEACMAENGNPLDMLIDVVLEHMPGIDGVCSGVLEVLEHHKA